MASERGNWLVRLWSDERGFVGEVAGGEGAVGDGATGAASGASGSNQPSTGSSSTGSTGNPTGSTKWEDDPRAKGMLSDLQKERKARQQFESDLAGFKARLEERDRQVAALTNSKPPSKEDVEVEAIKDRFRQLFPHLADLSDEDIEAIRELKDSRAQLQQTVEHHWTEHSRRMLSSVYEKVGAEIGDLTPRQQQKIAALYVSEAERNPEFLKRHDAGDKTLVDEFVKNYLEDTVEPVRRKITATDATRFRPVPNGNNRTLPNTNGKPIDVKDDKAVMDFIMESRRGKFAR